MSDTVRRAFEQMYRLMIRRPKIHLQMNILVRLMKGNGIIVLSCLGMIFGA